MQLSEYLQDMIGRFVSLMESGERFVGLCPFHNETEPSFTVNPKSNVYHCFGCGAHGHAESFEEDLAAHRRTKGV